MLVFFMAFMLYYNVTICTFMLILFLLYFIFTKAFFMITLTPTHAKTTLLCVAFLLAGAGCQQQADTPQPSNEAAATDSTAEMAHDEHTQDAHADHDEHSQAEHDEHGHDDHAGHDHAAADMTTYTCQPEQMIEAHYEPANAAQAASNAYLLIDGIEYDLTAMTAPTGSNGFTAYETDIGINNDAGMTWQVSTDTGKAILSNKTLDGSVAKSDEAVLFDCQKTDS